MRRRVPMILAVLLAAALVPNAQAGDKQLGARQTATSTSGIVAYGNVGGSTFGPGRPPHYDVVYAAPSGVVTGTGPLDAGSADLRRTWIAFDERDGTSGANLCNAFANPTSSRQTYDGAWGFHSVFDVSCPSDPRSKAYRVFVDADPGDAAHWEWQSTYETHSGFAGDGTLGSARVLDTYGAFSRMSWGSLKICGWDGRSFSRCSSAGGLQIWFTDGITAVERPY